MSAPAPASPLPVAFRARTHPLAPVALAAQGSAARALAARLLARDPAALAKLRGVGAPGVLIVGADEPDALPWVDGALYLGRDPAAPALLLPTAYEPDVPAALLERALASRITALGAPLAVLLAPTRVASLAGARPLERAQLAAYAGSREAP